MKAIAFLNNQAGVGKSALVYHLASMYADLGFNVLAADLNPQGNLTSMFLDDEALERIWLGQGPRQTIYGAFKPLLDNTGDVETPHIEEPAPGLGLIAGDLALLTIENELSRQWPLCLNQDERAFRLVSAFRHMLERAGREVHSDLVLVDVGSNLSALNRSALVAVDCVVVPIAPSLHSVQGLRNLGPTLHQWRSEWAERQERNPNPDLTLPDGMMQPIGYVVMQDGIRLDRALPDDTKWLDQIPEAYSEMTGVQPTDMEVTVENDPHCLAVLQHFRSLMPYAEEARKPMFALKPADGPVGSQVNVVRQCYREFRALAEKVASICNVAVPR